jgi:light-regulated signal transduction histidine kinase (bacteriophytochrome)
VEEGMTPADRLAHAARTARDADGVGMHERAVAELNAKIEQLERERDAAEGFAALAAHELMAPLVLTEACVSMAGERLRDEDFADVLQALEVLGRGAARTRRMIETLLHESRASSLPVRRRVVDMAKLTRECVAMLDLEIRARDARVAVGPMPEVLGEEELLGGLMTNLLTNALKFSPRHATLIRIGSERRTGEWVVFVESEGLPIPESDRERIFQPYHRGRGERRARGVGLGLAICRRIAERHGGTIGVVDAEVGEGNRFFVTLPD